jgi:hypothetical protein
MNLSEVLNLLMCYLSIMCFFLYLKNSLKFYFQINTFYKKFLNLYFALGISIILIASTYIISIYIYKNNIGSSVIPNIIFLMWLNIYA